MNCLMTCDYGSYRNDVAIAGKVKVDWEQKTAEFSMLWPEEETEDTKAMGELACWAVDQFRQNKESPQGVCQFVPTAGGQNIVLEGAVVESIRFSNLDFVKPDEMNAEVKIRFEK